MERVARQSKNGRRKVNPEKPAPMSERGRLFMEARRRIVESGQKLRTRQEILDLVAKIRAGA